MNELPDNVHEKIEDLSEQGNEKMEAKDYQGAIRLWEQALDLVPEPKKDWEAAMWLWASIGDAYFLQGKLETARDYFFDALNAPEGMENPFVLYRLGEIHWHLGKKEKAIEFFLRAYMMDGQDIFEDEGGEEYLKVLKSRKLIK